MDNHLAQLVDKLDGSCRTLDILEDILHCLEEQTDRSLSNVISSALITLERWTWALLERNPHEWIEHDDYSLFFHRFSVFNKKLIFLEECIDIETKGVLLLPQSTEQITRILEQVEQSTDDNNPYITFVSLWFDNLSFLLHEHPQLNRSSMIIFINEYIASYFLMQEQYRFYLVQLQQTDLSPSIFTCKQLFYVRSCSMSLNAYFYSNPQYFPFTTDDIVKSIGDIYLRLIDTHSLAIDDWHPDFSACITHLIGFMRSLIWWTGESGTKIKILLSTEQILCDYIQAMIRMIEHKPFYTSIMTQWINMETILMDSVLLFLMNIIQTQNINWYFHSITQLPDILLTITASTVYDRIYLCAYGILSEILTDEHLKALRINGTLGTFFFDLLDKAWQNPSKKYKQIPIAYFLRGKPMNDNYAERTVAITRTNENV
jgi:hypothetical protein